MPVKVEIIGLEGFPEIKKGDDIGDLIVSIAEKNGVGIEDGDIIVVKSKIVSKAEGRIVNLNKVNPSPDAMRLAEITGKDPRLVEVILWETIEVVKATRRHLIVKNKQGMVCANAGVDRSNVAGRSDIVILLPEDPDESARKIVEKIRELTGKKVAVIITDTYGRPLRNGQVDMAIGLYGIKPFKDYRGKLDLKGYRLRVKRIALADELAATSELVTGNGSEGIPVAIIRGLNYEEGEGKASELNMPEDRWLFK